jgi:hypothetical protein
MEDTMQESTKPLGNTLRGNGQEQLPPSAELPALGQLAQIGEPTPTLLPPLTDEGLENGVAAFNLLRTRDEAGDLMSIMYKNRLALRMWFIREGRQKNLLHLYARLEQPIPTRQVRRGLAFVNRFSATYRWGKAFLRYEEGDEEARVCFSASCDCEAGITDAQLRDWLLSHLASAEDFLDLAGQEKGLFSPRRKPRRTRESGEEDLPSPENDSPEELR